MIADTNHYGDDESSARRAAERAKQETTLKTKGDGVRARVKARNNILDIAEHVEL